MGVDTEERVDFDRLRKVPPGAARKALRTHAARALLPCDVNNIRYVTSTAHRRVVAPTR